MSKKVQISPEGAKAYRQAGYELKALYLSEFKEYRKELSYTKAIAKLNREHHKEFRLILNKLAPKVGHRTTEVRRLQAIQRLESQLRKMKGETNA